MADNDSEADAEKLEVEILKNLKKTIWSMKLKLEKLKLKVRQITAFTTCANSIASSLW